MNLKDILDEIGLDAAQIFDVLPCAVFTVNTQRRITSWNKRAAEITGFSQEEALGNTCDILCSRSCAEGCRLFSGDGPHFLENRECDIMTKNGQRKLISKSSNFLIDKKGNVIGGVESFEDVTDRKRAFETLYSKADIVNHIDHPIYVVNKSLTYLFANNKLLERFNLHSLDEIIGKAYEQFHSEEQTQDFARRVEEVFATGKTVRYEYHSLRDNPGTYFRTLTPNKNSQGQVETITISSDDISTIKADGDCADKFITICAYCKKIKDRKGNWIELEAYFSNRDECQFSHGMCPHCAIEAYKELDLLRPELL